MNYESSFDKNAVLATDELDAETIRKRRRLMIGLLVVVAILVAGLVAWRVMGGKKDQGPNKNQVPLVTVAVPGQQSVTRTANATGSLDARVDMPVGVLGEGGRVLSVLVEPGAWVQRGQILVVIERTVQAQQLCLGGSPGRGGPRQRQARRKQS